jgi:hypothetical protein
MGDGDLPRIGSPTPPRPSESRSAALLLKLRYEAAALPSLHAEITAYLDLGGRRERVAHEHVVGAEGVERFVADWIADFLPESSVPPLG